MKDYYDILGISPSASIDEVKRAFRELIRKHHPDKNSSEEAIERSRDIIEAYKILTDREAKLRYDKVYHSYYNDRQSPPQGHHAPRTHEPERSMPEDPILQKWIRAAQRQAKNEIDDLIKDFPEAVGVAAKGAFQYAGYYILLSVVLYIFLKIVLSS
jgi:curved DNA-binding protein CbpA